MSNVGVFSSICMSAIVIFTEMSSAYEFTSVDFASASWFIGIHLGYFSWCIFVSIDFANPAKLHEFLYPTSCSYKMPK